MSKTLDNPKIYHITHVNNLESIIEDRYLWSDAQVHKRNFNKTQIGMSGIKRRRLEELEVGCNPGTKVGEYVPFYFCPRSIMLYMIYCGNHPELDYKKGQTLIVHLQCDLHKAVNWANRNDIKWAFTTSNAGARFTEFFNNLSDLNQVNWEAVNSSDFRDSEIKDGKQAEFLMFDSFPWELIEFIGVYSQSIKTKVDDVLLHACHRPAVSIRPQWYY